MSQGLHETCLYFKKCCLSEIQISMFLYFYFLNVAIFLFPQYLLVSERYNYRINQTKGLNMTFAFDIMINNIDKILHNCQYFYFNIVKNMLINHNHKN